MFGIGVPILLVGVLLLFTEGAFGISGNSASTSCTALRYISVNRAVEHAVQM